MGMVKEGISIYYKYYIDIIAKIILNTELSKMVNHLNLFTNVMKTIDIYHRCK